MAILEEYKRIVKHGGSYRVSIPPIMRKALNLKLGDYMRISLEGNNIVMGKATPDFTERKTI